MIIPSFVIMKYLIHKNFPCQYPFLINDLAYNISYDFIDAIKFTYKFAIKNE